MSSERDETRGGQDRGPAIAAGLVGVGTLLATVLILHFQDPSGWNDGWLDGDHLVVEEFREDDGSEIERIVVHALQTGKRLESRDPSDGARAFALVNGRVWLAGLHVPGFEAWDAKTLKTSVTRDQLGLSYADSNSCHDGAFAQVTQKDGRYGVVDLAEAKVVQREVNCSGAMGAPRGASSGAQSSRGWLGVRSEGGGQRQSLVAADALRLGGNETFLDPEYLTLDRGVFELEGDVFVAHRVELGQNTAKKLSRVSTDGVRWTVPLGAPGSIRRVLFSEPSTLVVIGHDGLTVLDVKRGNALWRAGK